MQPFREGPGGHALCGYADENGYLVVGECCFPLRGPLGPVGVRLHRLGEAELHLGAHQPGEALVDVPEADVVEQAERTEGVERIVRGAGGGDA